MQILFKGIHPYTGDKNIWMKISSQEIKKKSTKKQHDKQKYIEKANIKIRSTKASIQ